MDSKEGEVGVGKEGVGRRGGEIERDRGCEGGKEGRREVGVTTRKIEGMMYEDWWLCVPRRSVAGCLVCYRVQSSRNIALCCFQW